jgi:hypothetical protein
MNRASLLVSLLALPASFAFSANTMPLSPAWNIAPSGTAASSGELLFRVTPADGEDATEVTVFVLSGTNDTGVASSIRRALNSQLRADRFNVEPGEGANVLLTSVAKPGFSLELVDSDVQNVRVAVQSAEPVAPPTVPRQSTPSTPPASPAPPAPAKPSTPGDVMPPADTAPADNASQPAAPPPANSPPLPNPSPPPDASGGAPASAPPPIATPEGNAPSGAPPSTKN